MKGTPFLLFSGLGLVLTSLAPKGLAQSIKPGTEIEVHLLGKLDTSEAKEGQMFSATLAQPLNLGGKKTTARGTRINGRIIQAVSPGRLKRPASITLVLTSVGGTPVETKALQIDGKSYVLRNAALIGGGAAAGATVGAIADGGKGAIVGTAVGTGAGTETAYVTGRRDIVLPPETELDFVVVAPDSGQRRTPEPVAERRISHSPESSPAIWHDDLFEQTRKQNRDENDDAYDALILSDRDKWMIHSYFESNYGNLPPALSKRGGDLPHGLEKRLRREEILPPGLQNRVEPLPSELEHQLPRLPWGYTRVFLSGRVLILADGGEVVDLMFIYH